MKLARNLVVSLISFSAITLLGSYWAQAATFTWNGSGGNVNWATAGNWIGGAPTSDAATDLIFAGATNVGSLSEPLNQNIANPMILKSITFSSTAGNFFLGGSGLVGTGGSTFTITQSSANNQSVANSIGHTGSNNTTVTLALAGNGGGAVTLSGAIADGNGQRFVGITKSGTSTFVMTNAANSYTGVTTIRGGSLVVGAAAPSGSAGALGSATSADSR